MSCTLTRGWTALRYIGIVGEDEGTEDLSGGMEDYGVPQDSDTTPTTPIVPFDYASESSVAPAAAPAPVAINYTQPQSIGQQDYTEPQDTITLDTYALPQDSSSDAAPAKAPPSRPAPRPKPPPKPTPRPRTSTNEAFSRPMGPGRAQNGLDGRDHATA